MGTNKSYELFKKYVVDADGIEDFLLRYTKHSRHYGRGEEYAQTRIESYKQDFEKYGFVFIPHHSSKTGEVVSYYGPRKEV